VSCSNCCRSQSHRRRGRSYYAKRGTVNHRQSTLTINVCVCRASPTSAHLLGPPSTLITAASSGFSSAHTMPMSDLKLSLAAAVASDRPLAIRRYSMPFSTKNHFSGGHVRLIGSEAGVNIGRRLRPKMEFEQVRDLLRRNGSSVRIQAKHSGQNQILICSLPWLNRAHQGRNFHHRW
jgi:hypothetical protein